jgi:hypothetical protein
VLRACSREDDNRSSPLGKGRQLPDLPTGKQVPLDFVGPEAVLKGFEEWLVLSKERFRVGPR